MPNPSEKIWDSERQRRNKKLARAASALGASLRDKVVPADMAVQLLEAVIESGDRVCLEGNKQKQADFLAQALTRVDPARVNRLHMLQSAANQKGRARIVFSLSTNFRQ
jgi:malonate decarboxylase alpha subunit